MFLEDSQAQIDYLYEKKVKEVPLIPEKQMAAEFVRSFNTEAKKQNSKWFAEFKEHTSSFDGKKFILLHIHKRELEGWWIFKTTATTSVHVGCYDYHYSFVDNDFEFSEYQKQRNQELFKLIPEIRKILENIPQVMFINYQCKSEDFYKHLHEITKDIVELEEAVFDVESKANKKRKKC